MQFCYFGIPVVALCLPRVRVSYQSLQCGLASLGKRHGGAAWSFPNNGRLIRLRCEGGVAATIERLVGFGLLELSTRFSISVSTLPSFHSQPSFKTLTALPNSTYFPALSIPPQQNNGRLPFSSPRNTKTPLLRTHRHPFARGPPRDSTDDVTKACDCDHARLHRGVGRDRPSLL
jgi:hypothetical protein